MYKQNIFSTSDSLSTFILLISLLLIFVTVILLIINLIRIFLKKKSHKLLLYNGIVFVCGIFLFIVYSWQAKVEQEKRKADGEFHQIEIQTGYDFEVKDGDTPLKMQLTNGFDSWDEDTLKRRTYREVYDQSKDGLILKTTNASAEMCKKAIKKILI